LNNIQIIKGDITTAKVDAIVNAANPIMLGGGGVDGAIHKKAGPKLLEACQRIKKVNGIRCPVGQAQITEAGRLDAKHVIHTVGPHYRRDNNPELMLASAYSNCLKLAASANCQSIAFPAISCGAYAFPATEAAYIAIKTCLNFKNSNMIILFYLFDNNLFNCWSEIYKTLSQ